MWQKLSHRLLQIEKFRTNAIFFGLLTITVGLFQRAGAYISQAAGVATQPLDLEFFFSANRAYELIATYNEAVRSFYIPFELTADMVYPFLYSTYLSLLSSFLLKINWQNPHNQAISLVNLSPFATAFFDFWENLGIVVLVANYSTRLDSLANLTGVVNGIKWIFAGFALLSILVLTLRWLLRRFRQ
ncbi:MAG: hypothetical protein MUE85_05730 [Microscillaceae bacterium]|jgi:hypothetical protein|nr:hypothetical protein [Microscillaceae bacterium]